MLINVIVLLGVSLQCTHTHTHTHTHNPSSVPPGVCPVLLEHWFGPSAFGESIHSHTHTHAPTQSVCVCSWGLTCPVRTLVWPKGLWGVIILSHTHTHAYTHTHTHT